MEPRDVEIYKSLLATYETVGFKVPCIDLNNLVHFTGMNRENTIRKLKNCFTDDELTGIIDGNLPVGPQGGRPSIQYMLTLNQASLFVMKGNTQICDEVRQFFSNYFDISQRFNHLRDKVSNFEALLNLLHEQQLEHIDKRAGVYIAYPPQLQSDDGIVIKVGKTDDMLINQAGLKSQFRDTKLLKFVPTYDSNRVMEKIRGNPDFSACQVTNSIRQRRNGDDYFKFQTQQLSVQFYKFVQQLALEKKKLENTHQLDLEREKTKQLEIELELLKLKAQLGLLPVPASSIQRS